MVPINSINHFPTPSFRFRSNPVTTVSATTRNAPARSVEPTPRNQATTVSINQLPEGPANETTDIIRRISTRAHQAAELGQTFENRELLQAQITQEISHLRTVFEELSQNDLRLFVAFFQNQPLIGPSRSDRNQDTFITDLSLDRFVEDFPESFFRIDVTSELGSLAALELTGNALDLLSGRDSESELLESLLDNLTNSIFNFSVIESPEQDRDDTETEEDQDDTETEEDSDISQFLTQDQFLTPVSADSNPQTIIDLVG